MTAGSALDLVHVLDGRFFAAPSTTTVLSLLRQSSWRPKLELDLFKFGRSSEKKAPVISAISPSMALSVTKARCFDGSDFENTARLVDRQGQGFVFNVFHK